MTIEMASAAEPVVAALHLSNKSQRPLQNSSTLAPEAAARVQQHQPTQSGAAAERKMKARAGVFARIKCILIQDVVFVFAPPAYWIHLLCYIWDVCDRVLRLPPTQ